MLIKELELKKENANKVYDPSHVYFNNDLADYYKGASAAFSFCIEKLKLLLNEQQEAITEDSHFRKHDVGRSAAENETTDVVNVPGESSSETQAVGQNEQTKEVCFEAYCDAPLWWFGNIWLCERGHRGVR